jgi:hypothetical protein
MGGSKSKEEQQTTKQVEPCPDDCVSTPGTTTTTVVAFSIDELFRCKVIHSHQLEYTGIPCARCEEKESCMYAISLDPHEPELLCLRCLAERDLDMLFSDATAAKKHALIRGSIYPRWVDIFQKCTCQECLKDVPTESIEKLQTLLSIVNDYDTMTRDIFQEVKKRITEVEQKLMSDIKKLGLSEDVFAEPTTTSSITHHCLCKFSDIYSMRATDESSEDNAGETTTQKRKRGEVIGVGLPPCMSCYVNESCELYDERIENKRRRYRYTVE